MIKIVPGEPAKVTVKPDSWNGTLMNVTIAIGRGHKPPTPEGVIAYIWRQLTDGGYLLKQGKREDWNDSHR